MEFEVLISARMDWMPANLLLLDQYLMMEMIPVSMLAVGKCAIFAISLGALRIYIIKFSCSLLLHMLHGEGLEDPNV